MPMCEACWSEAYRQAIMGTTSQTEHFQKIVEKCEHTPKEKAGQWWDEKNQRDERYAPVDKVMWFKEKDKSRQLRKENDRLKEINHEMIEAIRALKRWYNGTRTGVTYDEIIEPLFEILIKAEGKE